MDIRSGLTTGVAAFCLFMAPYSAAAHGKAIAMGKMEDAAKAFGPGAALVPFKEKTKDGDISWFYVAGSGGEKLGWVGVAKETTEHGYLAQATALSLDGKIIAVFPLRVMEDEKTSVDSLTRSVEWWREGAPVKPEGAALVLLKSARRVASAAVSLTQQ